MKFKLLASDPIYVQQFESIDAENGIIKGVKVCSEGDAKGHGVYLNKKFINNVVKLGKEQTVGVKARFGHPNMCDTTLGTFIGRYKRFRTAGEENEDFEELGKPRKSGNRLHAVADLHLDETSKNLPKLGDAWDYLTKLADSSPDMFGSSIVFMPGANEVHEWEDEDKVKRQRVDATINSLLATDLVDSPAATDGLFSEFSKDEMAIQVTHFLDQHPEVYELAVDNPDIVEMFMGKYADYKTKKDSAVDTPGEKSHNQIIEIMNKKLTEGLESLKAWFAEKFKGEDSDEVNIPEEAQGKLDALESEIKAIGTQEDRVTELEGEVETITGERDTAQTSLETANGEIDNLKTQLSQAKAKSTQVAGKEGMEGVDGMDDEQQRALASDVAKIKGEFA